MMKFIFLSLTFFGFIAQAGNPPNSPFIFDSACASGVFNLPLQTCSSIGSAATSVVIPTAFTNSTSVVTSASTTFVTAITHTVTLASTSPIHSIANFDLQSTTAATVAQLRIQINSVNGPVVDVSIDNTTDHLHGTAQYTSASLPAGTYTITAQIARLSGTGTVSFFQGSLFSQGQQGFFSINNPSNIIYVGSNGVANGATGTFTNPYLTISAAVTAANTAGNTVIAIAPGSYSDAAPVTITGVGVFITSMTQVGSFTGDNRTQNDSSVKYSGSFIYAPTANFGTSGLSGIEVDVPTGAAWNTNPYAVTISNSHQNRFYISNCVLKASNLTTRGALQINGASQIAYVTNSLLISGTTTGPNTSPLSLLAGQVILRNSQVTDIQTSNAGTAVQNSADLTSYGGVINGAVVYNTSTALWDAYAGTVVNSGANVSVQTYSVYSSGYFTCWDCALNTSNTNAINGIQIVYIGSAVYATGSGIASTVNNGAGMPESQFLLTDTRAKYYEPNPGNWATSTPTTLNDAINRISTLLKTLNGGTPIP